MFSPLREIVLSISKAPSLLKNLVRCCYYLICFWRPFKNSFPSLEYQGIDLTHKVRTLGIEAVAQGGFSDIYDGELEDVIGVVKFKVAIKLLRCFTEGQYDFNRARKRLNHEFGVLQRAAHSNIVIVFGTSYHMGGRPAMIMPWYPNGNAREYLQTANSGVNKLELIRDIARGLLHLHTLTPPIIHGDLKANNILITNDGHAVICDFGSSQALDKAGPIGNTTTIAASLRWQPPELILVDQVRLTPFSDIWSFACTACEIWVEKVPYSHCNREATIMQDILQGVKPFEQPTPSAGEPDELCWELFRRCWNYCPAARPSTVEVSITIEKICGIR